MNRRILVVEDDPDISVLLAGTLSGAGYDVQTALDAKTGLAQATQHRPDLVVLDLGLPDGDGGQVLARLRRTSAIPVIVLTARDALDEKMRLFDLGADDYVLKPYNDGELLARVKVQFRAGEREHLEVGDLDLNILDRHARFRLRDLHLSPREFDLLTHLARTPGRVVRRDELARHVWNGQLASESNVIDVHVSNLRRKLRDGGAYGLLRTVRGVGYALREDRRTVTRDA